jgi:hypothetical protein
MFFTNIFGLSERSAVCEHAYQSTRQTLLARYDELAPIFARHGVTLRRDVLEEPRQLWEQVGLERRRPEKRAGGRRKADIETSRHTTVSDLDAALSRLEKMVAELEPSPPGPLSRACPLPPAPSGRGGTPAEDFPESI